MKQGRATHSGSAGTKVEPTSHAKLPGGVAQLGQMQGNHVTEGGRVGNRGLPLYAGRGLEAPMKSQKTHKGGSQGSY